MRVHAGASDPPSVAVVVPLHNRKVATAAERMALRRCARVLGAYPLIYVAPAGLDVGAFREAVRGVDVQAFDGRFFGSARAHNELLLSEGFYDRFAGFDFILLHHLDAFVFEDHMRQWCYAGYDYVGAPWFKDFGHDLAGGLVAVGNGGFSLRNVAGMKRVLRSASRLRLARFLDPLHRSLRSHLRHGGGEDIFWGVHAARYCPAFRVAPVSEAVYFAFETGLPYIHGYYEDRLPFGCHAGWNLEFIYDWLYRERPARDPHEQHLQHLLERAGLRPGLENDGHGNDESNAKNGPF